MKNFFEKCKRKISGKNVLFNFFSSAFFVVFFLLAIINQQNIHYYANGFSDLLKADFQVYYLDVGQANATLIIFPNKNTMLIDAGSRDSQEKLLNDVDFLLKKHSLFEIDFLLLTHSDEDHIGGASAILQKYQIYNVFRPKVLSSSDKEVENSMGYQTVSTQVYNDTISAIYSEPMCEVNFFEDWHAQFGVFTYVTIYAPKLDVYDETNAYSPFVLIENKGKTFLFTGDATKQREVEFVDSLKTQQLSVDFLMVSHHGSKHSTTKEFLEAVSPKTAIISAGDSAHPSQIVLNRLKDAEVEKIYCTKNDGMIAVAVAEDSTIFVKTDEIYIDLPVILVVLFLVLCVYIEIIKKIEMSRKYKIFYRGKRYK